MRNRPRSAFYLALARPRMAVLGSLLLIAALCLACSAAPESIVTPTAPPVATAMAIPSPILATTVPAAATPTATDTPTPAPTPVNMLAIDYLRGRTFPGSDIKIEQKLDPGVNYSRYIASYESDRLKIYGLLTVPDGKRPARGWPAIVFNHGYIPPYQYKTTGGYVAYVDDLARSGYVVFKIDYRGHGDSEGTAESPYITPGDTIDSLNALASLQRYPDVDPKRIGMWGHSMGGQVTLRAMVVSNEIRAGVIWGGVVGSFPHLMYNWPRPSLDGQPLSGYLDGWRSVVNLMFGTPEQNPGFWNSISPNSYVGELSGPLQLHHGQADGEVPIEFSQELYDEIVRAGGTSQLYTYPGNDHNISQSFGLAMQRTIAWFDKYLK